MIFIVSILFLDFDSLAGMAGSGSEMFASLLLLLVRRPNSAVFGLLLSLCWLRRPPSTVLPKLKPVWYMIESIAWSVTDSSAPVPDISTPRYRPANGLRTLPRVPVV